MMGHSTLTKQYCNTNKNSYDSLSIIKLVNKILQSILLDESGEGSNNTNLSTDGYKM